MRTTDIRRGEGFQQRPRVIVKIDRPRRCIGAGSAEQGRFNRQRGPNQKTVVIHGCQGGAEEIRFAGRVMDGPHEVAGQVVDEHAAGIVVVHIVMRIPHEQAVGAEAR